VNKTELIEFRRALEKKQVELRNGSKSREALAIEPGSDEMDRVQRASERDSAIDELERNASRSVEIREALRRLESGVYGICTSCEEDIHPKRLAAVPWVSTCIACQETAERELKASSSESDALLVEAE